MSAEPVRFGDRLAAVFSDFGQLCVGIDPHPYLLDSWGLPDTADGLREFGLRVVAAAAGIVGIVKPQVAFFERHGAAGYASLEIVLAAARMAGLLVIADVKRGDLGSTVEAYARAWLTPGGSLEADAMTISVFQGVGSIAAPIAIARQHGKGLFVLAATSNPESEAIQTATIKTGEQHGLTVAAGIVNDVVELNRVAPETLGSKTLGSIGVVLGATVDFANYGIARAHRRPAGNPGSCAGVRSAGCADQRIRRALWRGGALRHCHRVQESSFRGS